MAICGRCGQDNVAGARFCSSCGNTLSGGCSRCGEPIPAGARFCPSCGLAVVTSDTTEVEMIKLVTILFADVVGSTAQAEKMAPEDVRELMADFLQAMSEEIVAEGGIVERFVGDAIMADFGIPVAHEDDPVRAVRAARRMLDRLDLWNEDKPPPLQVQIRIGVNTGEVSAGGSLGQQLLVMGDSVNVAARLEQIATPGTIVIGPRTARAVRGQFQLEELPPVELKGQSQPIAPFLVIDEIPAEVPTQTFSAPMVGRDVELDALVSTFDSVVREQTPRLVTLIGDAGVGKSRLITEFVSSSSNGARILMGRCLAHGEGVTLWPLREILRAEAGVFGVDPPDVAFKKIAEYVAGFVAAATAAETDRTAAALASTIGLEAGLQEFSGYDPREVYREVLKAWRAIMAGLSTQGPVVLVVEDLHWADETLLAILQDLANHSTGPILFLTAARPDLLTLHPEFATGIGSYSSLTIEPLNLEQSARLVNLLLQVEELPEEIRYRILEKAEGNPFFLEEILQRLIDEGYLNQRDGRWVVDERISEVQIPENVQSVVLARIDLLEPEEKTVIQQAAVIGRTFWSGAVNLLAGVTNAEDVLRSLSRRHLVTERLSSSLPGEAEYSFKHVLIRDVAYESLPRRARGRAHAAAAGWIEEIRGERVGEVAELLTHHYELAHQMLKKNDLRRKAREYALIAAQTSARRFAIRQAESFGKRAVDLSAQGSEKIEALEAVGDLYVVTGNGDGGWRAFTEAIAEIEKAESSDSAALARLASKAAILATRWEPTMENPPSEDEIDNIITLGLNVLGDEPTRERCLLLASGAFLARVSDETVTLENVARSSLEIAEKLEDPVLLSVGRDAVAFSLLADLRFAEVERLEHERVKLVPQLTDVKEICDIYGSASWSSVFVGNYKRAEEFATLGIERARGIDPGDYLHGLVWRSQARFMGGDWDGALHDVGEVEALEVERGSAPSSLAARAYGIAAFIHELRDDRARSDQYLDAVRRHEKNAEASPSFAGLLTFPARTLAHRGDLVEAREWLYLEKSPYLGLNLEAACEVVPVLGDWDLARAVISVAEKVIPQEQVSALTFFIARLNGRMAFSLGDVEAAAHDFRFSSDGFVRIGALWEQAWSRLLLAEAHARIGPSESGIRELAAARITFQQLGSSNEVRRCDELAEEIR